MKEMVKVTVIATGFEPSLHRDKALTAEEAATPAGRAAAYRQTPAPFPIRMDTPPFPFTPKGIERPDAPAAADRPAPRTPHASSFAETDYNDFETPAFIRNKNHQLRKYSS
jgi:hypothetical protein